MPLGGPSGPTLSLQPYLTKSSVYTSVSQYIIQIPFYEEIIKKEDSKGITRQIRQMRQINHKLVLTDPSQKYFLKSSPKCVLSDLICLSIKIMRLKNSPCRNTSKYYPELPPHYCMPINYANNTQKIACLGRVAHANC